MKISKNTRFVSIIGIIILTITISAVASSCGKGSNATNAGRSAATTSAPAKAVPLAPKITAQAATKPAAPSTPSMTVSEQQAVTSAQSYLNLGNGFSYNSLLQQLTSANGSGFSTSDAKYAINYLHPDWDTQAVEAAQEYMKLGNGFSRSGLIKQLTSSYGNGFTESQAEYAADKVGL
jgi:hypothetical protein